MKINTKTIENIPFRLNKTLQIYFGEDSEVTISDLAAVSTLWDLVEIIDRVETLQESREKVVRYTLWSIISGFPGVELKSNAEEWDLSELIPILKLNKDSLHGMEYSMILYYLLVAFEAGEKILIRPLIEARFYSGVSRRLQGIENPDLSTKLAIFSKLESSMKGQLVEFMSRT